MLSWLKYSYFWVRVQKNPRHYDLPALGNVGSALTDKLQELALKDIEKLEAVHAVTLSEDLILSSTDAGKQMAKWNIAYEITPPCIYVPPLCTSSTALHCRSPHDP